MMKKNNRYIKGLRWVYKMMLCSIFLIGLNTLVAQPVQVGELLTFADGSKGIVCYVDPANDQKGWVVDLQDMPTTYQLYNRNSVYTTPAMTNRSPNSLSLYTWTAEGKANTNALYKMNNGSNYSPAARAVNPESGWYIPDADQMMKLVGMVPFLKQAFERADTGSITQLTQNGRHYWTSTRSSTSYFYYLYNYSTTQGGYLNTARPNASYYIRRVRDFDFGNEAHAYWIIQPKKDTINVKPEVTTTYEALVVYLTDTFTVQSSVIVYPTFNKDTVYGDTVFVDLPYDKLLHNVTFHVTGPGNDTLYDTLKTVNGCDSIQTVILHVRQPEEIDIYDTVCQSQTHSYTGPLQPVAAAIFGQTTLDSLVRVSGHIFKEKVYLKDALGNDSTVNFYFTVNPWTRKDSTVTVTNWQGASYNWHDSLYTEPGSHAFYTQETDGCDYLDVLHLVILDIDTSDNEICLGDSSNLKVSVTKREMTAYSDLIPYVPYIGDVLCTDGTVLGVDSFLNSGKTAKGVVFYVDEEEGYGRAIALSNAYSNSSMLWSSNRVQYSTTTYTTYSQASQDMNGKANTNNMINKYSNTASYVPAAHHCYYYNHTTYGTGTQPQGWYLPAAGEMILIYGNRIELNKTLNKLRTQNTNNTLLYNNTYWTSSEYNNNYAWYFLNTGNLNYTYKNNNNYYARPVIQFPLP